MRNVTCTIGESRCDLRDARRHPQSPHISAAPRLLALARSRGAAFVPDPIRRDGARVRVAGNPLSPGGGRFTFGRHSLGPFWRAQEVAKNAIGSEKAPGASAQGTTRPLPGVELTLR
jgi:hypothetical protein